MKIIGYALMILLALIVAAFFLLAPIIAIVIMSGNVNSGITQPPSVTERIAEESMIQ